MIENYFFLILIGMNIGVVIGWYACKRFKTFDKLMEWFDER